MHDIKNLRYKECTPEETVNRIQGILDKIGVMIEEEWLKTTGIYSVQIRIENTSIYANGKGINEAYARAGAYAELMERLQTGICYRLYDNWKYDCKKAGLSDVRILPYIRKYLLCECRMNDCDVSKVLDYFKEILPFMHYKWIEFAEVDSSERLELPSIFVDIYYGSNGMAAGNTRCEALVQGMCEIVERYALRKIFEVRIDDLADVTEYICKKYENLAVVFKNIAEAGYTMKVIDLGAGMKLPVVAVIILDKKRKKYFVSLASHPALSIAVERAITEIFQGRSLEELHEMMSPIFCSEDNLDENNLKNIFVNGEGFFPKYILAFAQMSNKISSVWDEYQDMGTNKELFQELSHAVKRITGNKIYVADFSCLEFPTYQIVVPNISEITKICDYISLKRIADAYIVKKYIAGGNYTKPNVERIISYLEGKKNNDTYVLKEIYNLPLDSNKETTLDALNIHLMLSIFYCFNGNYAESLKAMEKFNYLLSRTCGNQDILDYYELLQNILELKVEKYNEQDIENILETFYESDKIKEGIFDLKHENVCKNIVCIPCLSNGKCNGCAIGNACLYKSTEKLLEKIF